MLILLQINVSVKIHPLSFKSTIFSEILVSKINADTLLQRRVCRVSIAKNRLIRYFSLYLFTLQSWYILLKLILRKRDFKFSLTKHLFRFFKTLERDYLFNLVKNKYSLMIHIMDYILQTQFVTTVLQLLFRTHYRKEILL